MNQKNNMGYQKTHEKIKKCFVDMINTQPLPKITIQDLCKAAAINRSTFYAHYQDIYDLSNQLSDDLNRELLEDFDRHTQTETFTYKYCLITMLEHFKKYNRLYYFFISDSNGLYSARDMDMLHKYFIEQVFHYYNITDDLGSYYYAYTQTGFFAVVRKWLENGCPESPEVLGRIILDLQPPTPDNEDILTILGKTTP